MEPRKFCTAPSRAQRENLSSLLFPQTFAHLLSSYPILPEAPGHPETKPGRRGLAIVSFGYLGMGMGMSGRQLHLKSIFYVKCLFQRQAEINDSASYFPAGIFLLGEEQTNVGCVAVGLNLSAVLLAFLH